MNSPFSTGSDGVSVCVANCILKGVKAEVPPVLLEKKLTFAGERNQTFSGTTAQVLSGVTGMSANTSLEDVIRFSINQLLYETHGVIHNEIAELYVPSNIS